MDSNEMMARLLTNLVNEVKDYKNKVQVPVEYYSIEKAAKVLDISLEMLQYYTRPDNVVIPFAWIGKHKRFSNHDLKQWYDNNRVQTMKEVRNQYKARR